MSTLQGNDRMARSSCTVRPLRVALYYDAFSDWRVCIAATLWLSDSEVVVFCSVLCVSQCKPPTIWDLQGGNSVTTCWGLNHQTKSRSHKSQSWLKHSQLHQLISSDNTIVERNYCSSHIITKPPALPSTFTAHTLTVHTRLSRPENLHNTIHTF